FGNGVDPGATEPDPRELARASVLDAVLEDAAGMRGRLGMTDRRRLDEHMEAIHELQNRIRGLAMPLSSSCVVPADPGSPTSYRERARAMADLTAMAFSCDLSRV